MIPIWSNFIRENEIQLVVNSFHEHRIMEGPYLKEFESGIKDLLGTKYAIGVSSGTAALTLALMGIGIKPGDEVLVPDLTFIATANAACILGAKVVAVPTEKNLPVIDIEKVDSYITNKTGAIISVDLNGRIPDNSELVKRYKKMGIYLIEDACQAFSSQRDARYAGTQSDIGCFSFGITKTLTTGKGGMVITDNKEIYEKMSIIKTQGLSSVFESDEYVCPGYNFKFLDILASIGAGQLDRIDEKKSHMSEIDKMYMDGLEGLNGISFIERKEGEHIWMTDIICENRDLVRSYLFENDIQSRPLGAPLHTANHIVSKGNYTESDDIQKKILYLPSGPDQPFENVEKTIEILRRRFK